MHPSVKKRASLQPEVACKTCPRVFHTALERREHEKSCSSKHQDRSSHQKKKAKRDKGEKREKPVQTVKASQKGSVGPQPPQPVTRGSPASPETSAVTEDSSTSLGSGAQAACTAALHSTPVRDEGPALLCQMEAPLEQPQWETVGDTTWLDEIFRTPARPDLPAPQPSIPAPEPEWKTALEASEQRVMSALQHVAASFHQALQETTTRLSQQMTQMQLALSAEASANHRQTRGMASALNTQGRMIHQNLASLQQSQLSALRGAVSLLTTAGVELSLPEESSSASALPQ